MEQDEKVRENLLRRMATRQGLRLVKSRRRDPFATDFGRYRLEAIADGPGYRSAPADPHLTLDEVEKRLTHRTS
jgi:hypothetical protein